MPDVTTISGSGGAGTITAGDLQASALMGMGGGMLGGSFMVPGQGMAGAATIVGVKRSIEAVDDEWEEASKKRMPSSGTISEMV